MDPKHVELDLHFIRKHFSVENANNSSPVQGRLLKKSPSLCCLILAKLVQSQLNLLKSVEAFSLASRFNIKAIIVYDNVLLLFTLRSIFRLSDNFSLPSCPRYMLVYLRQVFLLGIYQKLYIYTDTNAPTFQPEGRVKISSNSKGQKTIYKHQIKICSNHFIMLLLALESCDIPVESSLLHSQGQTGIGESCKEIELAYHQFNSKILIYQETNKSIRCLRHT